MTLTRTLDNTKDVIDSRDVIARIEELEDELENARQELEDAQEETDKETILTCGTCGLSWNDAAVSGTTPTPSGRCPFEYYHDEAEELKILKALAEEGEYSPDWKYGETLIRDSYFKEYAQELAEDCCEMPRDIKWPYTCIDWDQATRELQYDYSRIDFDGVDYWIRS